MSSFIPPILSSSPPPIDAVDDEDDDFGDFAAAHYSSKEDTLVSKLNLDESSWNGPGLNFPPTQPNTPIKQNGTISGHTKGGNCGPGDWGAHEDEEIQQQTDNTSQNSVVSGGSGVTDSGVCSASQNSEGVSPLPQVDLVEEEAHSQTVSSPVVVCNNLESVNGSTVNDSVEDALNKSDENDGSASEESHSGSVSTLGSSPPDLDLNVNVMCKAEESSNVSSINGFTPNPDEWGATVEDDFGDFSAFDPPPPLSFGEDLPPLDLGDSSQSDLSPEEEVKEDSLQFREDLKPLEFEPIQPEEKGSIESNESIVIAEENGVRTLPVDNSDFGDMDDFSNFEGAYIPPETEEVEEDTLKTPVDGTGIEKTEFPPAMSDEEDDFADFESAQPVSAPVPGKEAASLFADFSSVGSDCPQEVDSCAAQWANPPPERPLSELSDADSFGDFESDTYQSSYFTCDNVRKRLPQVLSEMFPPVQQLEESVQKDESSRTDGLRLCLEDSETWQSLRDFESTPALTFHWPGSHANRCLLAALNIDSRNVLFGPKWSTVVPRFASNLSFSPLEPVRAGQMQSQEDTHSKEPEPVAIPQPANAAPAAPFEDVVPAAQFDWSGSGLENPLECKGKAETTPTSSTPPASSSPLPSPLPLPLQPATAPVAIAPVTSEVKCLRDPTLSPEAVRVLDSLPELAFLSAKKLMFPVYGEMGTHKH